MSAVRFEDGANEETLAMEKDKYMKNNSIVVVVVSAAAADVFVQSHSREFDNAATTAAAVSAVAVCSLF
jgi:hypothetical protein